MRKIFHLGKCVVYPPVSQLYPSILVYSFGSLITSHHNTSNGIASNLEGCICKLNQ